MADWIDTIKSVAPTVATALGGPLAGAAVTALGSIFGMSQPTTQAIGKMFEDGMITPDHLAEIRKLELDYQNQEKERGFKYADLEVKDRASAREMLSSTKAKTPAVLTYIITLGFFGVLGAMFFNPDVKESAPLMIMLGSLGTAWTAACAFWFGTTHGSQTKSDLLANSAPANNQ